MGRRKSTPQAAPSTLPEATATIERYLGKVAAVEEAKADADAAIAAIQAERDQLVAPLNIEIEDLFLQLRAWWAVAGPEMTKGKTKSIELAGALLGERTTTPSLKLPKGMKVPEAVIFIQSIVKSYPGMADLLRVKTELEKPALIKILRNATTGGPAIERIREEGFKVAQREEFFIDRAAPKEADPAVVDASPPPIAEARQ